MTRNRVTANLVMLIFIIGGLLVASQVKQEIFPEFELDVVQVQVPYPGASPEEVEKGILLAIEDEVRSLDDVKKVTSRAIEGSGTVNIELLTGADGSKLLQDVKNVVDGITSFPEEAERPVISLAQPKREVISLIVYGDQPSHVLRNLAERIRDDLIQLEGVTLVQLSAVPPPEISIEIPTNTLRAHNLTLDGVAETIRETALELPGGGVKTPGGEVLLRTQERRDYASEFENIEVISNRDGSKIRLDEIAIVEDTYEETDQESFYNGKRAVRINVFRVGAQKPLDISRIVRDYLAELKTKLPDGIDVDSWADASEIYRDRIQLLLRNAGLGLMLVLLLLGLFLEPHLAFWVMLGIPISIIGSFLFLPWMDASINMVSLFAFIVTLGIIVDDAVVVGEHIYQKIEEGMPFLKAAILGAREISTPVVFAVLTNITAFLPLFFVPGTIGKIFFQIPAIAVSVFVVSLIESLYVLPAHLSKKYKENGLWRMLSKPSEVFEKHLQHFINHQYASLLKKSLNRRYFTFTCGISILIIALGVVGGGFVKFSFLPRVDSDNVFAQVVMPYGVPIETSRRVQQQIVDAAKRVLEENGGEAISRGIYTQIGDALIPFGPATRAKSGGGGSHIIGVQLNLVPSNLRDISGLEFTNQWRKQIGEITGIDSLFFFATIGATADDPINIELSHPLIAVIENAAVELANQLEKFSGVTDIDNGVALGKPQLNFKLTPEAKSLGLSVNDLARQVRSSFYGAEALRQQRERNEVKVMVRLPENERRRLYTVEELILRTPQGGEIPLIDAALIDKNRAYTSIDRRDGRRVISVTADVDEKIANAGEILDEVEKTILPDILGKYPGMSYSLEGQERERLESIESLKIGYLFALIGIFTLLAIPFKSYIQPLIVMISIPFGIIGAIIGHLFLGYDLSIISMFGIIALSGVVVNDSLVLVVTANRARNGQGMSAFKALQYAGTKRFRPIILTSLTTFFGLAPMIFEPSVQARFLIPMAVSLGFGILFSTGIILLIVPSIYLIVEDFIQREA